MKRLLWLAVAVGALSAGAAGCTVDDTYASCTGDLDCNDVDDRCRFVTIPADSFGPGTSGGFCTHECASDAACEYNFGYDGVCYALEEDPTFLCYQQCDFDSDCWSGNVCRRVELDAITFDYICVPSN